MPSRARVTFYQYASTQLVLGLYFKACGLTTLSKKREQQKRCVVGEVTGQSFGL